jgi:hypothetical protein
LQHREKPINRGFGALQKSVSNVAPATGVISAPHPLATNRIAKRYIIAGALLAGITVAAVARQLGVLRSCASREANAAGTRILIVQLLALHSERLSALLDQTLDVKEAALKARKTYLVRGRGCRRPGPDHCARRTSGGSRGSWRALGLV